MGTNVRYSNRHVATTNTVIPWKSLQHANPENKLINNPQLFLALILFRLLVTNDYKLSRGFFPNVAHHTHKFHTGLFFLTKMSQAEMCTASNELFIGFIS